MRSFRPFALALVSMLLVGCTPPMEAPGDTRLGDLGPTGIPGGWRVVWSEDFGTRHLDKGHWSVNWPGLEKQTVKATSTAEISCYNASQVSLPGDGSLHLTLSRKTVRCDGKTQPYLGASVVTVDKFQYTYGAVEARIFVPGNSSGIYNWPAIWSNGASLNWPVDGENDTFEGLHGRACWHFHSAAGAPGGCIDFRPGWHTVASDWEPGVVTYYYDGHEVGQVSVGVTSKPQYLALQLSASAGWQDLIRPGADVRIDYLRVWRRVGGALG